MSRFHVRTGSTFEWTKSRSTTQTHRGGTTMSPLRILLLTCLAFLFACPARAQGLSNSELKGDYAFTFNGMTTGGGGASTVFAAVGRFTSDGAGNLTNGELDTNGVGPMEKLIAQAFTGTYTIGADNRGVMNLNIPGGGKLAFALMANGNAKFVEIDATGGHGTIGSGTIEKADSTSYSTAKIDGDYAFGVAGFDSSNNRSAIVGRFSANGAGMLANGAADINLNGLFSTWNSFEGNYIVADVATGRGILNLPPFIGGTPTNLNFVFYLVNATKIFAMETDVVTQATPLLNGVLLQQQTPIGGFTNSSLTGGMVIYLIGRSAAGCGSAMPAPNVIAGLLTADGNGGFTLSYDQNCGGAAASQTSLAGTYSIDDRGRVGIQLATDYFVAYAVSSNRAFLIVPDPTVLFGFGDPQASGTFSNASVKGSYAGSTTSPMTLGVAIFSGEFTADGVTPGGNLAGTEDVGAPGGATLAATVNATYSISTSPISGRGTFSGSLGGNGVIYVVSPSKFIMVSLSDSNPAVLSFDQ